MEDKQQGEERSKMMEEMENQTRELLDKHDGAWEHRKGEELGTEAILGPRSSPVKRTDSEAPNGASKKRRRILKYSCIGEDWGSQKLTPLQGSNTIP